MKGSTWLPVAGGAFGKQDQRVAGEQPVADFVARRAVAWRRARSTNTVRWSLARVENSGQVATSDLATKETCPRAEKMRMSSQDVWLATTSTPSSSTDLPTDMDADAEQLRHEAVIAPGKVFAALERKRRLKLIRDQEQRHGQKDDDMA